MVLQIHPKRNTGIYENKIGSKNQMITYGNRIELIPVKPMKKLKSFVKGIDTNVPRDSDRL